MAAPLGSIPVSEHYLSLPVTQLRLCVRIVNTDADAGSLAAVAALAAQSPFVPPVALSAIAAVPLPKPRNQDTALVLIHGWLDNSASWDRIAPTMIEEYARSDLAKQLTARAAATAASASTAGSSSPSPVAPSKLVCYCIEMSGHGDSDHRSAAGTYYPLEHALDMQQAIELLHLPNENPIYVCGHSMGGG